MSRLADGLYRNALQLIALFGGKFAKAQILVYFLFKNSLSTDRFHLSHLNSKI